MQKLITPDWNMFFTTLTQVSLALASLLFVSFTIYFTNRKQKLEQLEIGVGTGYYMEVITAFVLSALVILPPHDWYFGGGIVVALLNILFYVWIDQHFVRKYRKAHQEVYKGQRWTIHTRKPTGDLMVDIYERYKLPCDDRTIFGTRTTLLLLCSGVGVAVQSGMKPEILIGGFHLNLADVALEGYGILTALFLVSCVIGTWLFFFVYYQGGEVSSAPISTETDATPQETTPSETAQEAKKEEVPQHPT